jgi:prolyl 4-hydroxylase
LISTASSQLGRARVSDTVASQGTKTPGGESKTRTNSVAWLTGSGDPILEALEDKICDIVACQPENTEEFQVIYYEKEQEYRPHYDSYDMLSEHGRLNTVRGGNRLITMLLYLSDVDEGGGTSFPNLGLTVQAKKGRMLVFYNVRPVEAPGFYPDGPAQAYVPEPNALHSGDPVIAGTKWAVNKWVRQREMKPQRPRRLPPAAAAAATAAADSPDGLADFSKLAVGSGA